MYIVVDVDNTICDASHRVHHIQNKDWDSFHEALSGDPPNPDVISFLRAIQGSFTILAVTGRNERYRARSYDWFNEWEVPVDILLMRLNNDFTPDHILKPRMLAEYFGSWTLVIENVEFALDDRDKVVEAFRSNGLPCWQVRQGSY